MTYPAENFSPAFESGTAAGAGWSRFARNLAAAAGERVRAAYTAALANIEYGRRLRETYRLLSSLDDEILNDIGLHRGQILSAARRSAEAAMPPRTRAAKSRRATR